MTKDNPLDTTASKSPVTAEALKERLAAIRQRIDSGVSRAEYTEIRDHMDYNSLFAELLRMEQVKLDDDIRRLVHENWQDLYDTDPTTSGEGQQSGEAEDE